MLPDKSWDSAYPLTEFMREFPNDDACLEWLWRNRFAPDGKTADCPKCGREQVPFKKYETKQSRSTWTCTKCGHHVQPRAGTIFEGSSTPLQLWFYAIHLMTSTRCEITAKQLERELGVTYKTAWRMLNRIGDELLDYDGEPRPAPVEVEETSLREPAMPSAPEPDLRAKVTEWVDRGRGRLYRGVAQGVADVQRRRKARRRP
jgi:transposase